MNVTIRFFAQFRERFGAVHELTVPEGTRFMKVLHEIAGRAPEGETTLFAANGGLNDYVIVMRDSERLTRDRAEALELREGDTIAVFPPIAGG